MIFCPNCDAVLTPIKEKDAPKGALKCLDCDYQSTDEQSMENYVFKEELNHTEKSKIEIVEHSLYEDGIPEDMKEELREQYREALENFDL
ncbi:MAG: hypothetical protein OEZ01_07920 [Candidatus Heimdallarchaeota archaeon]|nr:hypothetical protein [Candidatus Heimdallarchaeota archaeon]MDH5645919.1 hypothetical protein [Candidatus Heimdallarchaeota archaeon]